MNNELRIYFVQVNVAIFLYLPITVAQLLPYVLYFEIGTEQWST